MLSFLNNTLEQRGIIMKKLFFTAIIFSLCLAFSGKAMAATSTSSLSVSASANVTCIINGTSFGFGEYTGAALTIVGGISVLCTNLTPYTITYNEGLNFAGSRRMVGEGIDPPEFLNYDLYCEQVVGDGDISSLCGDGVTHGESSTGIGTGSSQTAGIEAYLFGSQFVANTEYWDDVLVTITY